MGLTDLYSALRRRWLIVVAMTLVCLAAAAGYASTVPTTYTASTRLYVAMATGTSVNDSYQGGLAAQQRITSYSKVANGSSVAQRVIDNLGLRTSPEELQGRISATFPPATTLLEISVTDSTPDGARVLADGVAAQVRAVVDEMETTESDAAPAARLNVLDPAQTPTTRTSPDLTRILAVGLLAGLGLGGLAALAWDRFDRRVRRPEQLAELPAPVLASIPGREPGATDVTARLGARILTPPVAPPGDTVPTSLLLTSMSGHSVPGVAVGLATALARTGRQVAVVDADTTGNGVSARLGMTGVPGTADWLRTPHESVRDLVQFAEDEVGVLPIGAIDGRTSGLLSSERFVALLNILKARFDYVLVDAAPVAVDAAALTMSARCDRTLGVIELGRSRLPEVRTAAASLGDHLVGTVTVPAPSHREWRGVQVSPGGAARESAERTGPVASMSHPQWRPSPSPRS